MQRDLKSANRIVMVFMFIGVLILAAFSSMVMINNKTFVDKIYYRTVLDNARGLRSRPAIFFKGIEIGRIQSFKLNPDSNEIEVDFYVFSQFQSKLVRFAILSGNENMLLGDVSEFELILPEISQVKSYQSIRPGSLVPYVTSALAQSYIKNGFIKMQASDITAIIASVNHLLLNLQKENNPDAGSLFRILDRVAKITDHLLMVSEALNQSDIVDKAENTVLTATAMLNSVPNYLDKLNQLVDGINDTIIQANRTLVTYQQPAAIVKELTDGKVPVVLDSLNASLQLLLIMLQDVHAEREQIVITVDGIQKVLDRLDKTLQGINNNPLIKPGIEATEAPQGIEINE